MNIFGARRAIIAGFGSRDRLARHIDRFSGL